MQNGDHFTVGETISLSPFRFNQVGDTLQGRIAERKERDWRRFYRISLSGRVPDASTLIKLTNGPCQGLADEVHDALVRELARKKVLRGRKVRVDTTVVEADIHYPTDADLLADGVRVVTRTVRKLQQAGIATSVRFRNVTRSVRKRLLRLAKGLKQTQLKKRVARNLGKNPTIHVPPLIPP